MDFGTILRWLISIAIGIGCGCLTALAWPKYYYDDEHKIDFPTNAEQRRLLSFLPELEAEEVCGITQDLLKMRTMYWERLALYRRLETGTLAIAANAVWAAATLVLAYPVRIRVVVCLVLMVASFVLMRKRSTHVLPRPLPRCLPHYRGEGKESALEYLESLKLYRSEVSEVVSAHLDILKRIENDASIGLFAPGILIFFSFYAIIE